MPCTPVTLPGGARAIVCTRGRRPRCVCGAVPTLQCDAPSGRRSGTCDKHLCAACAVEVGPNRHLCPVHARPAATPLLLQDCDRRLFNWFATRPGAWWAHRQVMAELAAARQAPVQEALF